VKARDVAQPFRAARRALAGLKACATTPRRRIAVISMAVIVGVAAWIRLGPIPADLLDHSRAHSTVVVDRHDVPLYEALSDEGTRSVNLTAASLPQTLVDATVAVEDRRFWSHPGVDPVALGRAVKRNLAERQVVEGGSTISQQVAKLLLARRDRFAGAKSPALRTETEEGSGVRRPGLSAPAEPRGLAAKMREAVLALRLEHRFTKREILAMYLNLASYGNQMSGAERASRAYFGRQASMLTPAQAAFLAGLPQRPSGFNPYRSRDAAMARQRAVLRRMEASGALTADQARESHAEQLVLVREKSTFKAPHFVEMVLAATPEPRPSRIKTTIDAALQEDVAGIIRSHRPQLEKHGAANVAVVVLDNETGQWLAWEGSGNYADAERGGTINGPLAARQPGSALKPFTYALAFEHGFSPASVLPDIPSHFPTAEPGVLYTPRNYDGRYRGPLLARRALAGSGNVPAVALASELGVPALVRFLQRAGFTTFDRTASYYGLGVTLGNAEVRLAEMVAAYAAFARGGEWIDPISVLPDVSVPSDVSDVSDSRTSRTLVSPRTAFWITDILSDAEAREYIFGRGGSLEFAFPVAVKTGTSQAYHDNWTIGYTHRVTVGVWVGNFNRKPLRQSSGVTGAAPIFHGVMLAAHRRYGREQPLQPPAELTAERDICALSGRAANAWCPARRREWLAPDTPHQACSWHHMSDEGLIVVWPPEYREWAQRNSLLMAAARPTQPAAMRASDRGAVVRRAFLEIVNPPAGAIYSIDPTLRRDFQALPLRVLASVPGRIEWQVDGRPIGESSSDRSMMWPLSPGEHRITARHERGDRAETTVIVR
jgi:penicillin-binding protein 1C